MSWQNCVLTGKVKYRAQKLLGEYKIIIHKCKTISPHTTFVLFCFLSVWVLIWLLICISLMMSMNFILMCIFASCTSSLMKCLFKSSAYFYLSCLFSYHWILRLYLEYTKKSNTLWNYSPSACRLSFRSYKDDFEVFYFDKV